jgi:hypothetical protein
MKLPALARIPIVLLVVAACTSAPGASQTPNAPTPNAPTTNAPTPNLPTPSSESQGTPVALTPTPSSARPPAAALGYSDFAETGWLGTYCWQGLCADVFELPAKEDLPIVAAEGESLIFSMEDGEFSKWVVQYGPDGDSLATLDRGGEAIDPDVAPTKSPDLMSFVEFDNPPSGDWLLTVQVFFAEGDATYGWHVIVD